MKPSILTNSGASFDFIDLESNRIDIEQIAHALSQICRFTGHTSTFYSVAQHSVYVSYLVPPKHALAGLLHDAAEALLGDVSSPLKQLLPDYRAIESRVEAFVFGHFGLPATLSAPVKHADLVMLATEQRDLMPKTVERWDWQDIPGIEPLWQHVIPLNATTAKRKFLERFAQLQVA